MLTEDKLYKYFHLSLCALCLVVSCSIALSQIILIPLLLAWIISRFYFSKTSLLESGRKIFYLGSNQAFPLAYVLFVLAMFLSALVGIDSGRALEESIKTSCYLILPFCVVDIVFYSLPGTELGFARVLSYLKFLVFGQAVVGLHTFLSALTGTEIPLGVPGAVTESGQLVLVIPCALFLFIYNLKSSNCISNFSALAKKLLILAFPILIVVLLLNLKRGPWLGVFVELLILGYLVWRPLLYAVLVMVPLLFLSISGLSARLLGSYEDFSISGGRERMWELGLDLMQRFPMGIGPDNSKFIREMDPSLPELHRHLHNNLINVVVEMGWLGLLSYLFLLFVVIKIGFVIWKARPQFQDFKLQSQMQLALCLSTALMGWQVAGLVEYNFGDSEVRFIAFLLIGFVLALEKSIKATVPPICRHPVIQRSEAT